MSYRNASTLPRTIVAALTLLILSIQPLHAEARLSLHRVPPIYPQIAQQMHITGIIKVVATVSPAGDVLTAQTTSGNKILAAAAIVAVKQWKFAPGAEVSTETVDVAFQQ